MRFYHEMGRKILIIFGTRPEAIKMAPVVNALNNTPGIEVEICSTGQHREMLDQVLDLFQIVPDIDLRSMTKVQDLFSLTSILLNRLRDVVSSSAPDCILVHGDTTSSMVASMAAFYQRIPVGHVEAGLRTRRLNSPFPEEFNRRVTGIVADWHFAPTELNRQNLLDEKVEDSRIFVTGNTVVDALHTMVERINSDPSLNRSIQQQLETQLAFALTERTTVLVTCHRRENFGDGLSQICTALSTMAGRYPEVEFIFPVHLNPNVQHIVKEKLGSVENIHLLKPVSYEVFCHLLNHARLVLTDSGGVQEEAPSLGKPVLVMRENTERPEAVAAGTVKLVGADTTRILQAVDELMANSASYEQMAKAHNPYGDGNAASRIASILAEVLK